MHKSTIYAYKLSRDDKEVKDFKTNTFKEKSKNASTVSVRENMHCVCVCMCIARYDCMHV